jgi:flagellar protein FliS
MNNHVYQNYLENEVLTADPVKLVKLLYAGAIEAVSEARSCVQIADIEGRFRQTRKALNIINELALSLDHDKGGEMSRSLAELYDYMARRLNEANIFQSEAPLIEVQRLLGTLSEAWNCGKADRSLSYAPVPGPEYQSLSCTA